MVPEVTTIRARIRAMIEREAQAERSRDIVMLGLDGIPYDLAARTWTRAESTRLQSVFPTTSSASWLSSLSGSSVARHGIPGVVFKVPGESGRLINVFEFVGDLQTPDELNIFADAAQYGYRPVAIVADLGAYACSWRDVLLRHAQTFEGHRYYAEGSGPLSAAAVARLLWKDIVDALDLGAGPRLIWCYVEVDRHIHTHGYDEHVSVLLEAIEAMALQLLERSVLVVAHSDHGLTPTDDDAEVKQIIEEATVRFSCELGGAGRTRWLYGNAATTDELSSHLRQRLPTEIRVTYAEELFPGGSLARARVGSVLLIAGDERFVTPPTFRYDHGSSTDAEMYVSFSCWRP